MHTRELIACCGIFAVIFNFTHLHSLPGSIEMLASFKYYHNTHNGKLLIRKGIYFLHPVSPSPSCLCLFALHLFEVFLCLNNRRTLWWGKCLYMYKKSNVQITLQVFLSGVIIAVILLILCLCVGIYMYIDMLLCQAA